MHDALEKQRLAAPVLSTLQILNRHSCRWSLKAVAVSAAVWGLAPGVGPFSDDGAADLAAGGTPGRKHAARAPIPHRGGAATGRPGTARG